MHTTLPHPPHPPPSDCPARRGSLPGVGPGKFARQMTPRRAVPLSQATAGTATELRPEVAQRLREAQAFCFDVDSTLCEDESIDEVAAYVGVGEEVAAVTASAMGGTMLFQDALRLRLDVIRPSRAVLQRFLADHPPRLSPGIPELVALLQERGVLVFLVSGGFRILINPIADLLQIPRSRVFANTILFQEDGSYAGFDGEELTSRTGGKAAAARLIKAKHSVRTLVVVGDGATDAEARGEGAADAFVGYGGAVARPSVAATADWYIHRIDQLTGALREQ